MSAIVASRPVSLAHIFGIAAGGAVFAAFPQTQAGYLALAAVALCLISWAMHARSAYHLARSDASFLQTRRARRIALRHARTGLRWRAATHATLTASIVFAVAALLRVVLVATGLA